MFVPQALVSSSLAFGTTQHVDYHYVQVCSFPYFDGGLRHYYIVKIRYSVHHILPKFVRSVFFFFFDNVVLKEFLLFSVSEEVNRTSGEFSFFVGEQKKNNYPSIIFVYYLFPSVTKKRNLEKNLHSKLSNF